MFNFRNIFGGGDYKLEDSPYTNVGTAVSETREMEANERKNSLPCYQVGQTSDGRVTLYIGNMDTYYGGSTLTMNNAAVDQLIRMLEAAKRPEHTDAIIEETEGEENE